MTGCPHHPQSGIWPHRDGDRCPICGYFYDYRGGSVIKEPQEFRTFASYREAASRTDGNHDIQYYAGGLCEEAGECWKAIKPHVYRGAPLNRENAVEEIGDVLWELDQLAKKLGITLEEAAKANIIKLLLRWPGGFPKHFATPGPVPHPPISASELENK